MPKSNLCLIGLSKQFTDEICKELSVRLDMFYANVEQILEYELQDMQRMEELCGKEYLLKEEKSIIKRVATYENTVVNINYSNLNNETNLNYIKSNCLLIYLKLEKDRYRREQDKENLTKNEKLINLDLYKDRDFICKNISDLTILCGELTKEEIINIILEKVIQYYS